jgi:LysR family transcriptional regulator, nitrogen assimilation regulatory protein
MEIRQLKYFIAIADCGSLSKAAQRVYIAQSALSKQVAELEEELGVQLLHRTRIGVSVTESGKVFYEYAQAITKQISDARVAVLNSMDKVTGSVTLAIPQSVSAALALPLILAAKRRLPGITLHLNEELIGHIIEQLQYGRIDLAILSNNVPLPDFSCMNIAMEELVLIRAPDYPAELESTITLKQALQQPLILSSMAHGQGIRAVIERVAEEQGLTFPPLVTEINSVHILKSAVMGGVGCTIMPVGPIATEVANGSLKYHKISDPPIVRTMALCASSSIPLTNAKKAVSRLVQDVITELCESGQWPNTRPNFEGQEAFYSHGSSGQQGWVTSS